MKRWKAVVTFRSANGPLPVEHHIDEIEELQHIVERGPDWNTIERIVITLAQKTAPGMTIEQEMEAAR